MMTHSHGVWIWRLDNLEGDYIKKLQKAKVKRIYLKILDGKSDPVFWSHQCSKEIIKKFIDAGMEVWGWGYHHGAKHFEVEVDAIKSGFERGISGYVFDVESEAEDAANHEYFKSLLSSSVSNSPGNMAYTSFGHPGKHKSFPWHMFNDYCDLAMPQIYYERFSFGKTDDDEVQACLDAHKFLKLDKPILPIWCSEPGAKHPASRDSLQSYLDKFPGSSIWRAPAKGERSEAFNLNYTDKTSIAVSSDRSEATTRRNQDSVDVRVEEGSHRAPDLKRLLKVSVIGDDVSWLQEKLNSLEEYDGPITGEFDLDTSAAVRAFQWRAGIAVDGLVGPETWAALGGLHNFSAVSVTKALRMADVAMAECEKQLSWNSGQSEAEKYLRPMRAPMRKLGQIGNKIVFFNWCASFVRWCAIEAGFTIPERPGDFWATMAKVDAWKYWADHEGYWIPDTDKMSRGDIVVFEWKDRDKDLDHIGIVSSYTHGKLLTYEGNRGNKTISGSRDKKFVAGLIRIPG